MDYFMEPPDYRYQRRRNEADESKEQTPNQQLSIPAIRFPSYFVCSNARCSAMRQVEFHLGKRPRCQEHDTYARMNQVRFITICPNGHIDDFPWKLLLGCGDHCHGKLSLQEQGSSDLASIRVKCSCGNSENLGGATSYERNNSGQIVSALSGIIRKNTGSVEAGKCRGRCLWHGPDYYEDCDQDFVATFPNATNVYYSKTKTSIFIPIREDVGGSIERITELIERSTNKIPYLKMMWGIKKDDAADYLNQMIEENKSDFIDVEAAKSESLNALTQYMSGVPVLQNNSPEPCEPESSEAQFRRVEFNVLRQQADEKDIRTTPVDVTLELKNHVEKIIKVERLRETRVLYGFDRFEVKPSMSTPDELGNQALQQLFAHPPEKGNRWLPGKVVFGEGIYLELREDAISRWQMNQQEWIASRLSGDHNYGGRFSQLDIAIAPVSGEITNEWISRYLLIHTFAHILINQLVYECGYSTASLRERLYVSDDPEAPMAGILIYTSAGDSEGTLGGLVRLAQPEYFGGVIERACQRASWCSADPVCSEVTTSVDPNLAACHSCVLLPETSCEVFNKGLDRAMVVGTPEKPDVGYFSNLLNASFRQQLTDQV